MQVKMKGLGNCVFIFTLLLSCSVQAVIKKLKSQGKDCSDIKKTFPDSPSGIYVISPAGSTLRFKAYCEMTSGEGWTVIQKRSGGFPSFDREWKDYKNGFGDVTKDYWLGLGKVYAVMKSKPKKWTLRVDLWDHKNGTAFATYEAFRLGNEKKKFKLRVGNYKGNAGDAIRGDHPDVDQNGYGFSTLDSDNDGCSPCIFGDVAIAKCTSLEGGGWWYSKCGSANLNGMWHPTGNHTGHSSGLHWNTWKPHTRYSVKATRMMIKSK